MMADMVINTKKLVKALENRVFRVTAVILAAVFLAGLIFSLRTISIEILVLSDAGMFLLFFFVFFFLVFTSSFLAALFLYKFDVRPGLLIVSFLAVPLFIPSDITAVIFDLFFSPREGFLAYLGDKYDIEILNNLLLENYSVFIFSFTAYAWKMMGSVSILIFFIIKNTTRKNKTIFLHRLLFLVKSVSAALVIFAAFIYQIPVMMKCYVSRYEYVYSFPDCFSPEIFTFIYSVSFSVIAIMLLFTIFFSKRVIPK